MWGAFVSLFRFFSVTLLNSCYFVLDHLHLAMAWLSSFSVPINNIFVLNHLYPVVLVLFTFFSFQIKNFLWDHLKNILPVGSNVEDLTREFDILKETLKDVEDQIQIQMAGGVMKKTTEQVEGWMKRVKDLQSTVESVKADYNNRSYFCNIYSISTRAVNKLKMVREEAKFINGVKTYTTAVSPPPVEQMPADPIEFGREMFESRLREALNFLRDDKEGVLGIWGMGGVGKTTLLEHINSAMEQNFSSFGFDKVVFVTASRESTTLKIQKELMKKLGLHEGGDDRTNIFNYLCNKSFLLLIDDLWEGQGLKDLKELKKVGVPLPLGIVGEHKRKLILTTRSRQVCIKMRAQRTIKLECLGNKDARLLFRYNAGVDDAMIQSNLWIGKLADDVADECDGLPIALITTGQALAETETVEVWQNALRLLKESKLLKTPGMDDPLPLLKFSYDHLENPRDQKCLLHCALWPEDELIMKDKLIQCWMGHGLLGEFGSIQNAYDTGHAIIDSLVKVCLLENPKVLDEDMLKNDSVKLHDVIRDMALWIVRDCGVDNDNKWVVLSGGWETAPRDKQTLSEVQKMTLKALLLPDWPFGNQNFPNLTTLIIHVGRGIDAEKMSFLKHLNALKYLEVVSSSVIRGFPVEICGLTKLEYLSLSFIPSCSLPEELKNLKNLKHLLLRDVCVSSVPVELLSNLVKLRELDLCNSDVYHCGRSIIDLLDFRKECLNSLGITVSSVLQFQKLTPLPGIFIRALCMRGMNDLASPSLWLLSSKFLGSHNIQFSLKTLAIVWLAKSIEELVIEEKCCLTSLHDLKISCCKGLKGIMLWKGVEPMEVFPNLRSLLISDCDQLKNVAWIANLPLLERVELHMCHSMERLVIWELGTEVEESGRIFFPSLRILELSSLLQLSSICDPAVTFPALEYLYVWYCPELMKLPFQSRASCPNLKKINPEYRWWKDTLQLEGNMRAFLDPLVQFYD